MPLKTISKHPIEISKQTARKFLLAHHRLSPPRSLEGKEGVLEVFDRLSCIQFDTINAVGRNADLVLQARVKNYSADILEELLYKDRKLIDGWDKMASIYKIEDWPYFQRRREFSKLNHHMRAEDTLAVLPEIVSAIRKSGPKSSIDFDDDRRADWYWAETRLIRAGMEVLYSNGELGIDHRINTRRVFDLIENLIPKAILNREDPNQTVEEYRKWHTLRRLSSLGMSNLKNGEYWYGMTDFYKAAPRRKIMELLVQSGQVSEILIENLPDVFYLRTSDLALLNQINQNTNDVKAVSFIAPLDNLLWNRQLIKSIFDFDYVWEVYKPKAKRQYGYYVLPVLYGRQFIARFDASMNRKQNQLEILNWWWEGDIQLTREMQSALEIAFVQFKAFTGASNLKLGDTLPTKEFGWVENI